MRFSIHTLAERAVVLFPLLLMGSQLVIHPATGLSAVHRQQLHIYADRATLALRNVEVFTVQLSALCLGAEGDSSPTLTQPAGVHAVHLSLREILSIVDTLWRNFLALKDIAAVSWVTAGLAEWNGVLSTRALGLVAGTEVTSALGWYGGAATSRGRVALGQD